MFLKHFPQSLCLRVFVLLPSCSPPLGAQELNISLYIDKGKGRGCWGAVPPQGVGVAVLGEPAAPRGRSSSILCSASGWENSISLHRKPVCQTSLWFGCMVSNLLPVRSTKELLRGPSCSHSLLVDRKPEILRATSCSWLGRKQPCRLGELQN